MIEAVWRVSSVDLDVESFFRSFPALHPDNVWLAGDSSLRPHRQNESGFNMMIARGVRAAEVLVEFRNWIAKWRPALDRIKSESALSIVDFGIFVEGTDEPMTSISFDIDDLQLCSQSGMNVTVSFYLCD